FAKPSWNDLPGQSPAVAQPAALLIAAMLAQLFPEKIYLRLLVTLDHDRKAVVERIKRPGFDRLIVLVAKGEACETHAAGRPARRVGRKGRDPVKRRTWDQRCVEGDSFLHAAFEPEVLDDARHGRASES